MTAGMVKSRVLCRFPARFEPQSIPEPEHGRI